MPSCLIVIPTYNERPNLKPLVSRIRTVIPTADVLIVDDASPDGTGQIADVLATHDPQVHVLHRKAKEGLGRAYVSGFCWGLERSYDRFVQMDADFSHDPCALPALLAAADCCDLVLGSRYVWGGGIKNWGFCRRALSCFGSRYARLILGLPLQDLTGGFKCWRRSTLEAIELSSIRSNGYSFQIEMTYRAVLRGYSVREVPILFTDRVGGTSKMSQCIVWEAAAMVWRLRALEKRVVVPLSGDTTLNPPVR